jgi:hypothetical protein
MAKCTKAQARKRLKEANAKVMACFSSGHVTSADIVKINTLLLKCIKRLE